MNLKELVNRKSPAYYTTDEACFVVENYIYQVKGIMPKINIYKEINNRVAPNTPVYNMLMTQQLKLLNQAFLIAIERIKT